MSAVVVPGSLVVGDKEIELVMPVPGIGAEPLLAGRLEVLAVALPGRPGVAVGPAERDEGWAFAPLGDDPEPARRAAEAGAITIVLRDTGGTDMAGRPHEVVMGFRSIDLPHAVASTLERIAADAGPPDPSAPAPTLAEIRAAAGPSA